MGMVGGWVKLERGGGHYREGGGGGTIEMGRGVKIA